MHGHFWTLRLGGWSRNLFRREVGSCHRKEGAWRAGARALCCGGPGSSPGTPGRCLGTPWSPGWRVLLASGRWRPGVSRAPHGRPRGARGPVLRSARCLGRQRRPPPHRRRRRLCSGLGLSIGLRDASGHSSARLAERREMSFAFVNSSIL